MNVLSLANGSISFELESFGVQRNEVTVFCLKVDFGTEGSAGLSVCVPTSVVPGDQSNDPSNNLSAFASIAAAGFNPSVVLLLLLV